MIPNVAWDRKDIDVNVYLAIHIDVLFIFTVVNALPD